MANWDGGIVRVGNGRKRKRRKAAKRRNAWWLVDRWGTLQWGPFSGQDDARAFVRSKWRAQQRPGDRSHTAKVLRMTRKGGSRGGVAFRTYDISGKGLRRGKRIAALDRSKRKRRSRR